MIDLQQHVAIVGKTGSGKTYAAKGLVEALLVDHRRVCVIDPTGVWWGLRSSADGQRPGFPVAVFGGERGDAPLGARSAGILAELVAERNMPAVLDLSEMSMGEKHRFVTDFLHDLHRKNRQPLHLVIDEADEFAPQNPLPESKRMLHEVDRIVRRGRVRGFRVMLITQRPAVLHKNVLTQAGALIAMRLPAPQDRKAIEDWIRGQADVDQAKAVLASLSKLQRGEGWVWAPEQDLLERTTFPPIATFDSGRAPEDGEVVPEPTALAEVDLAAIRAALVDRHHDHDDAGDRKRTKDRGPSSEQLAAAEQQGFEHGRAAEREETTGALMAAQERLQQATRLLAGVEADLQAVLGGAALTTAAVAAVPEPIRPKARTAATPRRAASDEGNSGLHPAARALLLVLARRAPTRLTWQQTATLAGLKARGGHFNAGRKALRASPYLDEVGDLISATPAGVEAAGQVEPSSESPAEVLEMWCSRLPSPAPEMLYHLATFGPCSREELAAHLGKAPRGGHWNSGIAVLRSNGLIEERAGRLHASPLFGGANG